jgi:hypothetical protein
MSKREYDHWNFGLNVQCFTITCILIVNMIIFSHNNIPIGASENRFSPLSPLRKRRGEALPRSEAKAEAISRN